MEVFYSRTVQESTLESSEPSSPVVVTSELVTVAVVRAERGLPHLTGRQHHHTPSV